MRWNGATKSFDGQFTSRKEADVIARCQAVPLRGSKTTPGVSVDRRTEDASSSGVRVRDLLRKASVALESVTGCQKTYVMLFAEAEGFAHLHVHVVPRMPDQPEDGRGPDVFGYLGGGHSLPPGRRHEVAEALLAA